ncbi:MAG TPA: hypothetical protein VM140_00135 [Burkholderiales bacterium]|nr:hypothetical protein [Burkholderiales bacterium]
MERIDVLFEPVRVFLVQVGDLLPRLLLALLVLVAGYYMARLLRFVVVKALRAGNFHVLSDRAGIDGFLRDGGVNADTTEILGLLFYWVVILAALVIGFNGLGLNYITDLLVKVLLFVPKVMVAMLILVFGAYFARFIGSACCAYAKKLHLQDAELLGRLAQYAILTFVVLIALDQVSIGGDIIRQTFLIVLAGIVFALALAFGLGGKDWAAELLERWWPRNRKP